MAALPKPHLHIGQTRKRASLTDNRLGGTDNWSNAAQWSAGAPGSPSDVVIYSGGDDFVYLDMDTSINSLTLGGSTGTSYLSGYGNFTQVLDIANGITVNQTVALCKS